MKLQWSKKYITMGLVAFLVVAASILFLLFLLKIDLVLNVVGRIFSILMPIILGLTFAYLLNPILVFFEDKCFRRLMKKWLEKRPSSRLPRIFAITVTMLLVLLCLAGLLSILLPQLAASIKGLFDKIPGYLVAAKNWGDQIIADNKTLSSLLGNSLDGLIDSAQSLLEKATPTINQLIGNVTDFVIGSAIGVVNGIKNFVLGIIISIYVMFSKEKFAAQTKKILYALFSKQHTDRILRNTRRTHQIFGGFVTGKLLDSLIIGIITFIVLSIIRMPYTVLISVIVGITNIIPYFGPIIGAIPCALILLFEDPLKALLFIVIIIIIQQFDGNLLGPKILGDSTGLSAFWVIFAILLGGGLFGFLGMLLGVPTFAVIYVLIKTFIEERLRKKNEPADTLAYMGSSNPDFPDTETEEME